jgi:hypothetical protein
MQCCERRTMHLNTSGNSCREETTQGIQPMGCSTIAFVCASSMPRHMIEAHTTCVGLHEVSNTQPSLPMIEAHTKCAGLHEVNNTQPSLPTIEAHTKCAGLHEVSNTQPSLLMIEAHTTCAELHEVSNTQPSLPINSTPRVQISVCKTRHLALALHST